MKALVVVMLLLIDGRSFSLHLMTKRLTNSCYNKRSKLVSIVTYLRHPVSSDAHLGHNYVNPILQYSTQSIVCVAYLKGSV
jgi:hypothetical protein